MQSRVLQQMVLNREIVRDIPLRIATIENAGPIRHHQPSAGQGLDAMLLSPGATNMTCRLNQGLAAFACGAIALMCSAALAEQNKASRPNVLIIVGDDMGYADVGFHGCKDIPTPHLDALAASGVRFTNGYVSGPYCSPTRAGLLTGRYQQRFGHEFNPGGAGTEGAPGLPISETTIADYFKQAGYATGAIGKWHLGSQPQFHPLKRGFDEFYGFLGGANAYLPAKKAGGVPNILRGTQPVKEKEYLTDAIGRESIAFIDRHKAEPWMLYVAFNAVHTPMHADDARLQKFAGIPDTQRRIYAAMMSAMDDEIGEIIAKVREAGLEENTLVTFISDNGGPTMPSTTVNASSNAPFRGSKRQTLEGGIHVPFVVSWKGHMPAGKIDDRLVIQLDLLPTALAAAGIEVKEGSKLEGVNLLPYLNGDKAEMPHDRLFWRFGEQMAIREGDWKLVRYGENTTIDPSESWPKLYDISKDVGEEHDLASQHPDKVAALEAAWREWNAGNIDPLWGGGKKGARRRNADRTE
jgi:arylsulfatase A-like enzyme